MPKPKPTQPKKNASTFDSAHIIESFKQNFTYDKLPEEVRILFEAMDVSGNQKNILLEKIQNDDTLIEFIINNQIDKFIDGCCAISCLSEEQKQIAHMQLQNSTLYGAFNSSVNQANIIPVGAKRKSSQIVPNYSESNPGSDEENFTPSTKKKKQKLTLKEKLTMSFSKYADKVFKQSQNFLEKNTNSKNSTSSIRRVKEQGKKQYFETRLVFGPFGNNEDKKSKNGKKLEKIIRGYLNAASAGNLFYVDSAGSWKKDNKRDGWKCEKKVTGKVIRKTDEIGSVILIGSTAFTIAQSITRNQNKVNESIKDESFVSAQELPPIDEILNAQTPNMHEALEIFSSAIDLINRQLSEQKDNLDLSPNHAYTSSSDMSPEPVEELKKDSVLSQTKMEIESPSQVEVEAQNSSTLEYKGTFFTQKKDETQEMKTIRLFGKDIQIPRSKPEETKTEHVRFYFDLNNVSSSDEEERTESQSTNKL